MELGEALVWIRARVAVGALASPRVLSAVHANTVWARGLRTVRDELVGSGDGNASQTLRLAFADVQKGEQVLVREGARPPADELSSLEDEERARALEEGREPLPVVARVDAEGVWVRWLPVANFRFSKARSRHYVVDRVSGELTFGHLPFEPQYRALSLPIGRNNVRSELYGSGGGRAGNREPGAIAQVISSLPFVTRAANPLSALGGTDPETFERTLERGPARLRHRDRAVTPDDYDALARDASSQVALVHTLPVTNPLGQRELGAVTLVVVPESAERTPMPSPELLRTVETHLRRRAPETANHRVYVTGPRYVAVVVDASVVPIRAEESSAVVSRAVAALEAFFHPLTGGGTMGSRGFGSNFHISEVYGLLEDIEGLDFVLRAGFDVSAGLAGMSAEQLQIPPHFLSCSGVHRVAAVGRQYALSVGAGAGVV
jgi:hypothetical protein